MKKIKLVLVLIIAVIGVSGCIALFIQTTNMDSQDLGLQKIYSNGSIAFKYPADFHSNGMNQTTDEFVDLVSLNDRNNTIWICVEKLNGTSLEEEQQELINVHTSFCFWPIFGVFNTTKTNPNAVKIFKITSTGLEPYTYELTKVTNLCFKDKKGAVYVVYVTGPSSNKVDAIANMIFNSLKFN
ncbi:MAG: hypothetical protein ABFC34_08830 [Methanobacterium sp.]